MARLDHWITAARLPTLPAAIAPVAVGSSLAQFDGAFRWDSFALALLGALSIQVAANFANDASDAKRGADVDRVGPPRMVTAGTITPAQMWIGVAIAVAVSAATGIALFLIAGWPILAIGVISIAAMLTYVGGPIPYGYRGLGEVMVFVFFGLVATVGTRFAHDGSAGLSAWLLGAVMGSLAAAILMANNIRDLQTDRAVGKRTLAVMAGGDRARAIYAWMLLLPFAIIAVAAGVGWTPVLTGSAILFLPLARPLVGMVYRESEPERLIPVLAGTARLQLLVALAISAGALAT